MEQLKAMYPVCTLIKSDGTRCGSPALTGTNFCFQHIGGKIPTAKSTPQTRSTPLNFIYPSSHEAIQHNLFLVMQALSEGKIDNATAITYNRLLRSAQLNLQRWLVAKSKLNHDEVEQQMMPCAEPATNAGAPHPEETCESSPPSSSPGVGAPHLAVFEMWEDAQTSQSSDQRSDLDDPSAPSVLSVVKNENETPGELNAEPAAEPRSLNPDQPRESKSFLTWGEEHDLKLAEMKRLREQEQATLRGEDVPVVSPELQIGNR